MACPRSFSKSPLSSLRVWVSLLSPPPPTGCLTRTLWTWLGPAVSGSVFPVVRSVGGQGWKVGGWDHLEFCPTLTCSQMPSPSTSLKLTWIPEVSHGYPDAAFRASTPCPGPAWTLLFIRLGSHTGEADRQTEGEAATFHYPPHPLFCLLPTLFFPPLIPVPLLTSSSPPSSTSFPSSRAKAPMFQMGTSGVGASGICGAGVSGSGSGSGEGSRYWSPFLSLRGPSSLTETHQVSLPGVSSPLPRIPVHWQPSQAAVGQVSTPLLSLFPQAMGNGHMGHVLCLLLHMHSLI